MKREKMLECGLIVVLVCFLISMVIACRTINKQSEIIRKNNIEISEGRAEYKKQVEKCMSDLEELNAKCLELLKENLELHKKNSELKKSLKSVSVLLTDSEVQLLAKTVQCEVGSYSSCKAQRYCASVILNRVHNKNFPDSVSSVVYEKHGKIPQFSVAYNGMIDKCELDRSVLLNVAAVVKNGSELPEYVLYFYSSKVKENWVNSLNTYDMVDGTVFAYV